MTYGTGVYGLSPYGLALSGVLAVDRAFVTSERTVVVVLTRAPLQASSIGLGDALNPYSWALFRTDDGTVFHILASRLYTGTNQFELYTLEKFYDYSVSHTVSGAGLVEPSGAPIVPPTFTVFPGCHIPQNRDAPGGIIDLANPAFGAEEVAGTYQVDASGDYVNDFGEAFLLKIVIRRLSTNLGAFFHLQDYGLSLQLKEPIPNTDLGKLKKQIELQLEKEPEFSAVTVQISQTSAGIMKILVRAILSRTNQEIAIPVPIVNPASTL